MAIPVLSLITTAFSTVGSLVGSYFERKKVTAEGKVKVEVAKVEGQVKHAQTITEGEIEYDVEAVKGMAASYKDEWFVILFSIPFVMCFIPALQPYVKDGFIILRDFVPEWFRYCFIGMVVASFGLRGFKGWRK